MVIYKQWGHFHFQAIFVPQIEEQYFQVDDIQPKYNELPKKTVVQMDRMDTGTNRRIVFYNSLVSERIEVTTLRISHPNVQVFTSIHIIDMCFSIVHITVLTVVRI